MRSHLGPATALVSVLLLSGLAGCLGGASNAVEDLITDHRYSKLLVELDFAEGHAPNSAATSLLKTRIGERLDKPGGTTFDERAFSADRESYSNEDIRALEDRERSHRAGGDTMVLYVLYLNGHHAEDTSNEKVLGVHYGHASIAIFQETISSSGGLIGSFFSAQDVEKSVLVHEFGHAIGLVNNGLKMVKDHEDDGHPGHSTNDQSVMYWAVETTLGLGGITGTIPNQFDADDIADVQAGGGK